MKWGSGLGLTFGIRVTKAWMTISGHRKTINKSERGSLELRSIIKGVFL